jgi:hypothetical protein
MWNRILFSLLGVMGVPLAAQAADADAETARIMAKYQPKIDKGLEWLAKQQHTDGHWDAQNGMYPIAMTAMAGMALLSEGSTPHQGKYAKNIEKAVEYLIKKANPGNGLIGDVRDQREAQQYMYGHGFATMFLAQVYGEENDEKRREKLKDILTRAAEFTGRAQTRLGGWGYVSASDMNDFDEGSVTITQVQGLRAARDSGIPVDREVIRKAQKYLEDSTVMSRRSDDPKKAAGGVIYSLRNLRAGGGSDIRLPLTAAGISCMFNSGEYDSPTAIKWLNHLSDAASDSKLKSGQDNTGFPEYMHFYYAQVRYCLAETGHGKLRPDLAEEERNLTEAQQNDPRYYKLLKWSRYREIMFERISSRQGPDGSWQGSYGGVFGTAVYLIILQLDKGCLPILSR